MMIFIQALLIILYVLIQKHILSFATSQSLVESIAEIYNFNNATVSSKDNIAENLSKFLLKEDTRNNNTADLYYLQLENDTQDVTKNHLNHAGNVGDSNNFYLANKCSNVENKTVNDTISNKRNSKELQPVVADNSTMSSLVKVVTNFNNKPQELSTVESIGELYSFSSPTVMGMFNCTYENTINITNYPTLTNGSYVYDNHTIIPPDLLGNYDYEVLYDCSKRSVPLHKRACICRLKHCISLCSHNIIEFYQDLINDGETDDDLMNLFMIKMTLENKTVITKNIAKDFEHIVMEEFCEPSYTLSPEISEKLDWTLFENGTLLRHSDQAHLKKNEYCFELYQDDIQNQTYYLINPLNCAKKRGGLKLLQEFHYWTQVLSIPFFVLTIIAYFCLPDLRNVHGKCFMTYLSCLTISYSILSYINLSQNTFDPVPCLFMGYLNHYMQLSQYTWLGIICIDTWMSFRDYTYKASYHKYAMYGYHLPLIITFLTFVMQNSQIDEVLKPGISENRCGLEVNKWSASLYLYGPCLIILICCLISFIQTSRIIKANDQEVYKIKESQFECPRMRYTLYLRLFLMMGLSWFLDIVSYFLNMFHMKNLSELIDYINALQGLYIFVNFIGRRRVRNIIRERFCRVLK